MDCEFQSLLQWFLFFLVDVSCSGVFWFWFVFLSSLLDIVISEEVRQGLGLEEEQDMQEFLFSSMGWRYILVEVFICFFLFIVLCIVVFFFIMVSFVEGISFDSCLIFFVSKSFVGFSGILVIQGLLGVCFLVRLVLFFLGLQFVILVLQVQGGLGGVVLFFVSFQEGWWVLDILLI